MNIYERDAVEARRKRESLQKASTNLGHSNLLGVLAALSAVDKIAGRAVETALPLARAAAQARSDWDWPENPQPRRFQSTSDWYVPLETRDESAEAREAQEGRAARERGGERFDTQPERRGDEMRASDPDRARPSNPYADGGGTTARAALPPMRGRLAITGEPAMRRTLATRSPMTMRAITARRWRGRFFWTVIRAFSLVSARKSAGAVRPGTQGGRKLTGEALERRRELTRERVRRCRAKRAGVSA